MSSEEPREKVAAELDCLGRSSEIRLSLWPLSFEQPVTQGDSEGFIPPGPHLHFVSF